MNERNWEQVGMSFEKLELRGRENKCERVNDVGRVSVREREGRRK